jgi:hypothetical protein
MPRTAAVSNLSVADLERIIRSRHKALRKLERQRAKWQKKVDDVDRKIAALGGATGRRRRGGAGIRARNETSLSDAIAHVLAKSRGSIAVGDIMEGVLSAGYRSSSGNFRGIVNQALIKDKRFKSAGRGLYQMKAGAPGARKKRGRRRGRKAKGRGQSQKAADHASEATAGE